MKSFWRRVGPKSNDKHSYKRKERAERRMPCEDEGRGYSDDVPNRQHAETGWGQEDFSPESWSQCGPLKCQFQISTCGKIIFCLMHSFVIICMVVQNTNTPPFGLSALPFTCQMLSSIPPCQGLCSCFFLCFKCVNA
jgi:hypothetical protein